MESWFIEGLMTAFAYCATDHFLTQKIKGVKRAAICIVIAVGACCLTRFMTDSLFN